MVTFRNLTDMAQFCAQLTRDGISFRFHLVMPRRHVSRCYMLDTNRINAKGRLASVTRLKKWRDDDVIEPHRLTLLPILLRRIALIVAVMLKPEGVHFQIHIIAPADAGEFAN